MRRRLDYLTLTWNKDTLTGAARARAHSHNNHFYKYDGGKRGEFQCKKGSKEREKEGRSASNKGCNAAEPHARDTMLVMLIKGRSATENALYGCRV